MKRPKMLGQENVSENQMDKRTLANIEWLHIKYLRTICLKQTFQSSLVL